MKEDLVKEADINSNIYIDCNSKEKKMLIQVVEKNSTMQKKDKND